jgi:hypothetical protein
MQIRSKKLAAVAGAVGLAFAGAVLPATAAHAAWAPNCVEVFGPPAIQSALVQNDCSTTQRVRVIVAWVSRWPRRRTNRSTTSSGTPSPPAE